MTNSTFRNCGSRLSQFNQYDSSPTRGCGDDPETGCRYGTVFGFVTHSDQFNPEIMQATKDITFDNCGRRFSLENWLPDGALTSVSGRTQNWFDVDGSVSGLNEPTIIGSGLADAGLWWDVDNEVVHDQQGPLKFIKANRERGLGHFRMLWDDSQHSQVGGALCGNGNQAPCTALGYIKHLGPRFVNDNGLPVTARADVAGPVGGFGWLLELSSGAPRNLKLELIEVRPDTPMLLSIAYPRGTTFTITANAAWCTPNERYACQEQFYSVGSSEEVRNSPGNTYHVDNNGLLTIRVVQTPSGFVGNPSWFLPTYDDIGKWGNGHALPRFERGGVLLPKMSYGPYTEIQASCGGSGAYCSERPPSVDQSGVCPNGYTQTAFDACCAISNPSQCVYA